MSMPVMNQENHCKAGDGKLLPEVDSYGLILETLDFDRN